MSERGGRTGRSSRSGTRGTNDGRSGRSAVPDLLLRIVERRRERLAEARARGPLGGGNAVPAPVGGEHGAATVSSAAPPESEPALLSPRDNPFLAALTHPSRAPGAHPATPAHPARPATSGHPASPATPAQPATPAIIAEIKMGSPRLGTLRGRIDPLAQARLYADNGAAALSVVVEPDFFSGSYELLADCRAASGLPVVAKDFVVDPLQLAWARSAGADAVLLIAALYEPEELARYARLARGLGLVPLIETHDAGDLASLGGEPWELVGVNNRDLRTFEVDLERSIALLPSLPAQALKVAESGIRDALDVALLADSGFDALLIGEALLLAEDPAAKLRALLCGREVVDA
jgi:indole-3-glycerol phosphate synthase